MRAVGAQGAKPAGRADQARVREELLEESEAGVEADAGFRVEVDRLSLFCEHAAGREGSYLP
jgi:hypothetical protein